MLTEEDMSSDGLPHIKWMSTSQNLMSKKQKELQQILPCVVRIRDNQTSSHLPDKLVQEDLLLHSVITHQKVVCQCVDFISKDGQLYFSSQRFSIPLGYAGWLEILSEDGKAVSPVKTIEQVTEKAADKFLIRSKTKAFLTDDSGKLDCDKTKIVEKGEVMTIVGRLSITHGWRRQKKQIMHCLDSRGQHIYFDLKATGQFSPISGPTTISGVHSIEGIVNQFRLPLTVRIVSGQIPRVASNNDRPGVFRLIETQKDNTALFLPFVSHQRLMPVSLRTNIELIQASNMADVQENHYYKQLLNLCNKKVEKYFRTMQVLVSAKKMKTDTYSAFTLPARRKTTDGRSRRPGPQLMDTEEDVLFAEVDDLYAYVRRGGIPPKPRPRSWATHVEEGNVQMRADGMSSSQPILPGSNVKSRGLLATLTAGRYPTKSSTLRRQYKTANSPSTNEPPPNKVIEPSNIPVARRSDKIRSYIEKYHGSTDSLQTEVDPYIEDGNYRTSMENIDIKRKLIIPNGGLRATRPRTLSSSIEIMKSESPASSPTDKKGFKATICQLVTTKPKSQSYGQIDNKFIGSNATFQQTVQAT